MTTPRNYDAEVHRVTVTRTDKASLLFIREEELSAKIAEIVSDPTVRYLIVDGRDRTSELSPSKMDGKPEPYRTRIVRTP